MFSWWFSPKESKFFPLRVDPSSERAKKKQQKNKCRVASPVSVSIPLWYHALSKFSANQSNWSRLLIWILILNGKQCRSRSVGFFRSQLVWIYTVCKGSIYPGSAGQGLNIWATLCLFVCVEVLRPSQPNGVMSSAVSLPNHTFTGQA